MKRSIYIGYDPREADAYAVARGSLLRHLSEPISVHGLVLAQLQCDGLYTRPIERIAGRLFDVKSRRADYNGAMSTEFALSRFLVPHLAKTGWALFMDCDMLVRRDIAQLFALADPSRAVMCVKHEYQPSRREKMDGQTQTPYARKNWSSLMLFNCDHPANAGLTLDLVNNATGKDLHGFCWLEDRHIGALPATWNFLVGEMPLVEDAAVVHFTNGTPDISPLHPCEYDHEWRCQRATWKPPAC